MTETTRSFYLADFLDHLHTKVATYGNRVLRVQVAPTGGLSQTDAELLR